MDQEKKITMPRTLWDRVKAMMERDGISSYNEAVRYSVRKEVERSEVRAKEESK